MLKKNFKYTENTLNNRIERNLVKKPTNYRGQPYDIDPFTLCKKR